jgi:hypothetical protein
MYFTSDGLIVAGKKERWISILTVNHDAAAGDGRSIIGEWSRPGSVGREHAVGCSDLAAR